MADDTENGSPAPVGQEVVPLWKRAASAIVVASGLLVGIIGYPFLVVALYLFVYQLFRNAASQAYLGGLITLALTAVGIVCLRVRHHSPDLALGIFLPSVLWFGFLLFLILGVR